MKQKALKKLALNKNTVVDLNVIKMNEVKGGTDTFLACADTARCNWAETDYSVCWCLTVNHCA